MRNYGGEAELRILDSIFVYLLFKILRQAQYDKQAFVTSRVIPTEAEKSIFIINLTKQGNRNTGENFCFFIGMPRR